MMGTQRFSLESQIKPQPKVWVSTKAGKGGKSPSMDTWIEKHNDPIEVFSHWYTQAQNSDNFEPTAMTLATVDAAGLPDARVVLLKEYDPSGFCFFTNYNSTKSHQVEENPKAALVFHWPKPFHRQIRVRGVIEKVSYQESNDYFQTRPRGSQIGAWASPQSGMIESRAQLQALVKQTEERFQDQDIPCPENWGGFRLKPLSIEFWQAQEFRLHDRMIFVRKNLTAPWQAQRLAP